MSGIEYPPPKNVLPIFDALEFTSGEVDADYITFAQANANFCKYPTAQGAMTFPDMNVTGTVSVADGANTGTIDQISGSLTLSSSGNKVALATGNTLTFNNDSTLQRTAYVGKETVDDCDLHTFIYNKQNPATPKYFQASTFSMAQLGSAYTSATGTANTVYLAPIRLIKGFTISGIGVYITAAGTTPNIQVGIYRTDVIPNTLLCGKQSNTVPVAGMNYIDVTTPTSVPYTGIYYVGVLVFNNTGSLTYLSPNTNSFLNLGFTTNQIGVLTKASQTFTVSAGASLPSSLSGITPANNTSIPYMVVY